MIAKLKAIWLVLTSKNYVVIGADEYLYTKVKYSGIGNSLYKLLEFTMQTQGMILKDNLSLCKN